jgi:hypothetical protein
VIVLPSMRKSFTKHPQLGRMWERAHTALAHCTTMTIFGFSFPQSDCLVCDVFRDALKNSRCLRDVIVVDADPRPVGDRIASLLPSHVDIPIILCTATRDGSLPTWFRSDEPASAST